ncbi:Purine nucleoside phosphorylase [Ignavibacterium album JCM 16511]|uniref:Purine nucleoside phosphorylase n=1 Tax=Ignavibacterium album (strain DSM 19864 / JCM 16511 / NBRC 101810 / Mat9-16) TaxID=945713 RepID=I0AHU1_IGNAJ|nr:purine-nucleoside phosphorylase [Ignavibacterium album]AFH48548.1 Purine nucleoside phosphorylase [Ignavibacterium album JCM 16511]
MRINLNLKYESLIKFFSAENLPSPDIAIVLGSGLGDFANRFELKKTYRTSELSNYPASTIVGHEGKIHFVESNKKNLLLFQGRIHFYEGYKISECILPVFITNKLGCKKLILTNAAGGINPQFVPGDLMLATSLNGIFIKKELTQLIGLSSVEAKNYLLTLENNSLIDKIKSAANQIGLELKQGTYIYTKGPSYETPAEIQFFKKFGADAVGMSTVHEAIFSTYHGMETAVISCITNLAAGISDKKLSHAEVTETAEMVKEKFSLLLESVIESIA